MIRKQSRYFQITVSLPCHQMVIMSSLVTFILFLVFLSFQDFLKWKIERKVLEFQSSRSQCNLAKLIMFAFDNSMFCCRRINSIWLWLGAKEYLMKNDVISVYLFVCHVQSKLHHLLIVSRIFMVYKMCLILHCLLTSLLRTLDDLVFVILFLLTSQLALGRLSFLPWPL